MLSIIQGVNLTICVIFTACYSYQMVYAVLSLFLRPKKYEAKEEHRYAVLIPARNERSVLPGLIESIRKQNYPQELIDLYVVADNCTDDTAQVVRRAGAKVFERFNQRLVGKGYALHDLFNEMKQDGVLEKYDGFFVFDADNLLDENYIREMNKVFDSGYRVVTSYRNSKNYDSNWISAGYSLWFLREAKFLNHVRMRLHTSCAISGTGFLIHRDIVERNGGWKHYLLTEDIEFTVDSVLQGEKIGYCATAKLYDEQPIAFKQSWNQRLRWAKGSYQVFGHYGGALVKQAVKKRSFSCYDMIMNVSPAMFVTFASLLFNGIFCIVGIFNLRVAPQIIPATLLAIAGSCLNVYLLAFVMGTLTTLTEWKEIHCPTGKKIFYLFTFPLFMMTYIPIAVCALFQKITWKPIEHTVVKTIEDFQS
ncbi:glycosyltransferase family 2 protein [Zongyangia hominis]|uniref:Glycosyltransferase family 2 protein n=1 Tax=Zongyangia hominis TaxID=2763677 RepID=A0A926EB26_9FIRM|nr:glycosyltransferase family 2 protein [Zongyangia hominis]MBC8569755.1 glycosyltransferase family 2 protein [Zongyangia hominis]